MKRKLTAGTAALVLGVCMAGSGLSVSASPVRMEDGTVFDPEFYAGYYPDVYDALGTDPEILWQHYMANGKAEGRLPYDPSADLTDVPDYVKPGRTPVMQEGIEYHEIADDDDCVTFTFAGDINFDPDYVAGSTIHRRGLAGCFDSAALSAMTGSDIFMLNNEFTYTTAGTANSKGFTFKTSPSDASMLKEIGTDIVSLANNHTYDYMLQGLLDTMDTLDCIGMPYVGAGRNIDEASEPYYYKAGDMTIAVIAATEIERSAEATRGATATGAGVFRCYDPTLLYRKISDAKTKADFCIVFIHWGTERRTTADARQIQLARGMVDAGVDLIIGDHSHCLETIDYVDGVPVVYSLGNYVFANYTKDTCLFRVTLQPSTASLVKAEFLPLRCRSDCTVYWPTGSERSAAIAREQALSPGISIDSDGTVTDR